MADAQKIRDTLDNIKELKGLLTLASGSLYADKPYYISTRVPTLDFAITRPGIPGGKLTTFFGPEGGGKSTVVANLIAEVQSMGGIAMLHDTEYRFEKERAQMMGVDTDQLVMLQGATLEQSLNAAEEFIEQVRKSDPSCPILYVMDSLAGAVTKKRLEAEAGDTLPGNVSGVLSQNLNRLIAKAATNGAALVITNQLRSRISMGDPRVVGMPQRQKVMGQQDTMVGERALLYYSSLIVHVSQIGLAGEDKDDPTGIRVRATIRKCSIGPGENKRAEYEIDKLRGINTMLARFELLVNLGIIQLKGAWYSLDPALFGETKSFHRADFKDVWDAHPQLHQLVKDAPLLWVPSTSTE